MAFISGLVSQLGWGVESTAGTAVTVNKFQPHVSESIKKEINRAQGEGLYGSTNGVALASRHVTTTSSVSGDFEVELTDTGQGTLWRAALGSTTTPTALTGDAYQAVFQPGDQESAGSSLTVQVGRPMTSGTIKPFTFAGCKVTSFEFGGSVTDPLNATFSIDGRTETTATALATASYVAAQQQFTGAHLTVSYGGTASTSSGVVVTSGSTTLSGVKGVTVKGENPLATERFYAGSSGIKSEQVVNGYRTYEVELDMDFVNSDLYDIFVANTTTALKLVWQMPTLIGGGSSNYPLLEVILSAAKITNNEINVDGTELTPQKVTFQALFNGSVAPFQIRTQSTDAAL
jgi:hypothetical protein